MPLAEVKPDSLFEYVFNKPLDGIHHVFNLLYKTHFNVDLSKFGLTVGAQILVAEAFCNLIITVEPGNHKQLLIKLRRLRQRVKTPLVNAGRNQIVARAFGRRPAEHGGFNLDKAVVVEKCAGGFGYFVAQKQVFLQSRAAQIEIAIFKAKRFVYVYVVGYFERRGVGFG